MTNTRRSGAVSICDGIFFFFKFHSGLELESENEREKSLVLLNVPEDFPFWIYSINLT